MGVVGDEAQKAIRADSDRPPFAAVDHLVVVGLGLIGSSIVRVARARGLAKTVWALDADPAVCDRVAALGIADRVLSVADPLAPGWAEAGASAEIAMVCVPVGATGRAMAALGPHLAPGAIVSDVGSVKGEVMRAAASALPGHVAFVPGHPIAGTEFSGPDAGFAELFEGRYCVLTPDEAAPHAAIDRVAGFWRAAGSKVEIMTAAHHDLVLAITSHVPHLIAYNIVGTAADLETVTQSEVIKYSAGGFRDFTRIAASDPVIWRDIFLNNREAVLEMLGRFSEDLSALQRHIRWGDGAALEELFTRTRAIRRSIIAAGQESAAPDFGRGRGAAAAPAGPVDGAGAHGVGQSHRSQATGGKTG